MTTISLANREGDLNRDWAMDVLVGDLYAGRVVVFNAEGVQQARLYDVREARTMVATTTADKGAPKSLDEINAWAIERARAVLA